ncbi:MAG: hypothetical protein IAE94_01340 [Chthoniobacterales bacterium]|nr:hypothetical protein [Chthoniobacterales bacterium]
MNPGVKSVKVRMRSLCRIRHAASVPKAAEVALFQGNKVSRMMQISLPVLRGQSNHMATMKTQTAATKTTP